MFGNRPFCEMETNLHTGIYTTKIINLAIVYSRCRHNSRDATHQYALDYPNLFYPDHKGVHSESNNSCNSGNGYDKTKFL